MGIWGTGIYSNDTAEDVRDICQEIFPFVSVEEGNRIVFREFEELINSNFQDDDYASFWYALADWQWKHGILTDEIRFKTIELLDRHAGMLNWQKDGSPANLNKRIKVIEKLKLQLESPMPARNVPKGKLARPKHQRGDIIVFKSCSQNDDLDDFFWRIKYLYDNYLFRDCALSNDKVIESVSFDAYDRYMAILCVGTEQKPHSKYLLDLYDEYSVYAYYDFISQEKPAVDMLKNCGFLPTLIRSLKDFNRNIHGFIGWSYQFSFCNHINIKKSQIKEIEKHHCLDEVVRFQKLLQAKKYPSIVDEDFYDLPAVFCSFWREKIRLERVGMKIDNLLNTDVVNPELLLPEEADLAYRKWINA